MTVGCVDSTPNPAANAPANTNPPATVNKPVVADPAPANTGDANGTRRDNTAVNERDQNPATKTPLDQSNKSDDVRITAEIRQKIVNHEGMSINGRNVKVITDGGDVTLRGPVASQDEKNTIEKFAKDSARGKVDNQLEVAP
jgi:osmotically-inducible protein OsmY